MRINGTVHETEWKQNKKRMREVTEKGASVYADLVMDNID